MSARDFDLKVYDYRYGQPGRRRGLSVGVTRHLPRGVRKTDYARRGYFDVWLPLLAPSAPLLAAYQAEALTFRLFAQQYRREMREAAPRQVIRLLAAQARVQAVHLGCFCADAARCHRSLLKTLVEAAAQELPAPAGEEPAEFSSPACALPELED